MFKINIDRFVRIAGSAAVLAGVMVAAMPTAAQDLVAVSDLGGGSSVFVFRSGANSTPRKFISKVRTERTKSQRVQSAQRLSKQYVELAKVQPRRQRSAVVAPTALPVNIKTMSPQKAAVLFAGVGEYWMNQDNYDESINFFREALSLDPSNAKAQSGLSEALALKGNQLLVRDNPASARKFFEEALTYDKNNAPAYFGLGEVLSDMDEDDKAAENYEKALLTDKELTAIYAPLGVLYYQKGDIAKADELLSKAVMLTPDDARSQLYFGLVRFTQNRNKEAITALQKAKQLDPTLAEAFLYSGSAYERERNLAAAVADLTQATVLRPNYFEAWLALGSAQYESGNYPEAIKAYKEAVRLNNTSIEAYENLGDAYRQASISAADPMARLKHYNDAEAAYNLAVLFVERRPNVNKEQAADIYSKAAYMVGKQCEINKARAVACRWDVAVRNLEKATALNASSVDSANLGWAYYNAAKSDIDAGRKAEALPKLEKAKLNLQKAASADSSFVAGPLLNLGMALTDLGDFAGAEAAFRKVVAKEPNWSFALNELGIALRKQEKYKDAINAFKKAVDKDAKFAAAYYNLGEAQFRNGDLAEAKKAYQKLRQLNSNVLADRLARDSNGAVAK